MAERAKTFWARAGKAVAGVSIFVAGLVTLYALAAAQYADFSSRLTSAPSTARAITSVRNDGARRAHRSGSSWWSVALLTESRLASSDPAPIR
jgi:hypothetical protein